jgi:hypothetical protein
VTDVPLVAVADVAVPKATATDYPRPSVFSALTDGGGSGLVGAGLTQRVQGASDPTVDAPF